MDAWPHLPRHRSLVSELSHDASYQQQRHYQCDEQSRHETSWPSLPGLTIKGDLHFLMILRKFFVEIQDIENIFSLK